MPVFVDEEDAFVGVDFGKVFRSFEKNMNFDDDHGQVARLSRENTIYRRKLEETLRENMVLKQNAEVNKLNLEKGAVEWSHSLVELEKSVKRMARENEEKNVRLQWEVARMNDALQKATKQQSKYNSVPFFSNSSQIGGFPSPSKMLLPDINNNSSVFSSPIIEKQISPIINFRIEQASPAPSLINPPPPPSNPSASSQQQQLSSPAPTSSSSRALNRLQEEHPDVVSTLKLLQSAHKYGMVEMKNECIRNLRGRLSPSSVLGIWEIARDCDAAQLQGSCLKFIRNNLQNCKSNEEFMIQLQQHDQHDAVVALFLNSSSTMQKK